MSNPTLERTKQRAQTILAILQAAASKGERCPPNEDLGKAIACRREALMAVLNYLEASGAIVFDRSPNWRIVTITATGDKTADKVPSPYHTPRKKEALVVSETAVKVKNAILDAEKAGEPRPMGKTMAYTFGVSRGTISRIMIALQEEGVIKAPKTSRRVTYLRNGNAVQYDSTGNTVPSDDWQTSIRHGSKALIDAIRLHHPERLLAA